MPKLILSMDGLVLKELVLSKERTTIGRKPDNDIQIDSLAISGHHAVITCILDDAFLEDQNSTNGTYLNGQLVKKQVLKNSDVIELGKYRLKFIADGGGFAAAVDVVDAAALKPFDIPAAITDPGPAPAAAGSDRERIGVIQILSGASAGRELALTKPLTTLGKPGRQVAVITRRPRGYFITHVEGASFPLVNGRALDARPHPLGEHDIVELAGVKMEFFFRS
ncbi:FHA domain-containing protein [Thauera chlorobenzoica]|uniref:FHA domain protein n=1 Tax=Thauera chlorobenzoica TaxID=96773 RepID=A0A1H5UP53_9RHOO|nr:FHA domain-containing protein [Thauera chlorobenzoica]APR03514.1 FHA domain protein [Thauera chlorobenzoica]SEF76804.1 FHA domain-containing protein [Thauera chlorobenzoica]